MTISFEVPESVGEHLRAGGIDPAAAAREAFLVDLYRRECLSRYELGQALGLGRYETDGVLKRHDVPLDLTIEELRAEADLLDTTPAAIDRWIAWYDALEPLEMTPEEEAAWRAARRDRRDWEKARFDERADRLKSMFE